MVSLPRWLLMLRPDDEPSGVRQSVPSQSVGLVRRTPSVRYGAGKLNRPLGGRNAWIWAAVQTGRMAVLSAFSTSPPGAWAMAGEAPNGPTSENATAKTSRVLLPAEGEPDSMGDHREGDHR